MSRLGLAGQALVRNSRSWAAACAAASLVLSLLGCGGSGPESDSATSWQPQGERIAGADGAAVRLALGQNGVTIRVARDATGAPPLDASQQRAGAIYHFSPAGLGVGEAEIRIPFDPALAGRVQLAVAQPGGSWSVVPEAREDGGFLVARVQRLSFAVALSAGDAPSANAGKARALAAAAAPRPRLTVKPTTPITQTVPPLQLLAVRQPLTLGFDVELSSAAACAGSYAIDMQALVIRSTGTAAEPAGAVRVVSLGTRSIDGSQGTVSFARTFTSADNGTWFFSALATCRRAAARSIPVAYLALAPSGYDVRIAAGELPVIGTQPADVSVIEGDTASFTASATGAMSLQWERSNDGGVSFSAVPGATGSSLTLVTTLADDGALLRLRALNASGSVFTNAARLSVAERVIAPTISVDPVDQSVVEGQTASFSVAGNGKPTPTVQWQQRTNSAGLWSDIAGAIAGTYTTPPLTLAASGSQYRALLTNRGGQAESLLASLTVRPAIIAPAIVSGPQNATAPAGTLAFFSVTATGTAPLSYRWLRNGGTDRISDLGSSAFVSVDATDIGQPVTVTVEVSNPAGTVSASATLTATRAGVTIGAAGGQVDASDGSASLRVPAGALSADAFVSLTRLWSGGIALPAGYTALTDAYRIEPGGLAFAAGLPATLRLSGSTPIGEPAPAGRFRALALIRDPQALAANRVRSAGARSVQAASGSRIALPRQANVQRLAAGRRAGALGTVTLPDGQLADFDCRAVLMAVDSYTVEVTVRATGTYILLETDIDPCAMVALPPVDFEQAPALLSAIAFPTAQDLLTYNSQYSQPWWAIPDAEGTAGAFAGLDGSLFGFGFRNTRPAVVTLQHQFAGSSVWEDIDVPGTYFDVAPAAPAFNRASLAYRGPTTVGVHNVRVAVSQSLLFDPITGVYAGYLGFDHFSDVIGSLEVLAGERSLTQFPSIGPALTPAANPDPGRQASPQPALSENFGEIFLVPRSAQYDLSAARPGPGFNGAPPVVLSASNVSPTTPVLARRTPDGQMEALAFVRDGNVVVQHLTRGAEGEMSIGTPWTLTSDSRFPQKLAVSHAGDFSGSGAADFVLAVVTKDGSGIDVLRFGVNGLVSSQTLPDGPCAGPKRISHIVAPANRAPPFGPVAVSTRAALLFQGQGPGGTASTCVALLRGGTWSVEQLWTSVNTVLAATEAPSNAVDIDFDGTVVVAESTRVEGSGGFLNLALRTDSGSWQRKTPYFPATPGVAPDVAFDANGVVTLVFATSALNNVTADGSAYFHNSIFASRFSAGTFTELGSLQAISPPFVDATQPRLSVNSLGNVLAVFVLEAGLPGGQPSTLLASRLFSGAGWSNGIETVAGVNGSRMFDPWMLRHFDLGPVPYTPLYFGGSVDASVFWLENAPVPPSGRSLRRLRAERR